MLPFLPSRGTAFSFVPLTHLIDGPLKLLWTGHSCADRPKDLNIPPNRFELSSNHVSKCPIFRHHSRYSHASHLFPAVMIVLIQASKEVVLWLASASFLDISENREGFLSYPIR